MYLFVLLESDPGRSTEQLRMKSWFRMWAWVNTILICASKQSSAKKYFKFIGETMQSWIHASEICWSEKTRTGEVLRQMTVLPAAQNLDYISEKLDRLISSAYRQCTMHHLCIKIAGMSIWRVFATYRSGWWEMRWIYQNPTNFCSW